MKSAGSLFLLAVCCALLLSACGGRADSADSGSRNEENSIEIDFFYNEACGSCHDQIDNFYELFNRELSDVKDRYAYVLLTYNVFQQTGREKMYETLQALGYTEEIIHTLTYPILVCGGKVYPGLDAIEDSLREAYLTAGEDLFVYHRGVYNPLKKETLAEKLKAYPLKKGSASIVYFHRLTCEECLQTEKALLNDLPDTITANGKEYPLQLVTINTRSGFNSDIIQAFFEAYKVPEEDQMVPIVFTAEGYLAGYEDITENLLSELKAGAGLDFRYPDSE